LSRLLSEADGNAIDPEHLLAFVPTGRADLADGIQSLAEKHQWSREPGGHGKLPPMGLWADAVACALQRGAAGLTTAALDHSRTLVDREIHLKTLGEFHSAEAATELIGIGERLDRAPAGEALRKAVISTLNSILSFPPPVRLEPVVEARGRKIVEERLRSALGDAEFATALCALRGLGDESSLALVRSLGPLPPPWDDVPSVVTKAIRERLKQ
jgi:hypothetical protein